MSRIRQRGSSVLYVIVLSPIVFLSLALALEVGALQLQKERLRSAADMATISAASGGAEAGNAIQVDPLRADRALRLSLLDNLVPLQDQIVGMTPEEIAQAADVFVVTSVPDLDPLDTSRTLTRPTIEARVRVPVRSGLLSIAGLPPTVTLTVSSRADLRVVGGSQQ